MNEYRKLKLFKCGKQAISGTVDINDERIVFKVSKKADYVIDHEYEVMKRLKESVSHFCPNFIVPIDITEQQVEPAVQKDKNPFTITSKYPITKRVLLEQYVQGKKLYQHIRHGMSDTPTIYGAIKQTLSAIALAQLKCNFTHYDLHSDNVLLDPCDKDLVLLYKFNKDLAFAIPTHGYTSKIIDYGFSYVDSMEGKFLDSSLGHTDVGFTSQQFDPISDPKLFLISTSYELANYRKGTKKFSNITKNLFSNLTVDWTCGWDDYGGRSVADALIYELEKKYPMEKKSKIFGRYSNYAVDLMSNLVVLPLKKGEHTDLHLSYYTFVKEFVKIEKEISSSAYNLYILQKIIDSARKCRDIYFDDEEKGVTEFRRDVNAAIMSVSKFCSPRNVHYERMFCALLNFAECANGRFYEIMEKKMEKKRREYKELPLATGLDILQVLNANLEDGYEYNENTTVVLIDVENETTAEVTLDENAIELLNRTPSEYRGILLATMTEDEDGDEVDTEEEKEEDDVETEVDEEGSIYTDVDSDYI
jgi:hypothetical protein